jgi:hypothetical protein
VSTAKSLFIRRETDV